MRKAHRLLIGVGTWFPMSLGFKRLTQEIENGASLTGQPALISYSATMLAQAQEPEARGSHRTSRLPALLINHRQLPRPRKRMYFASATAPSGNSPDKASRCTTCRTRSAADSSSAGRAAGGAKCASRCTTCRTRSAADSSSAGRAAGGAKCASCSRRRRAEPASRAAHAVWRSNTLCAAGAADRARRGGCGYVAAIRARATIAPNGGIAWRT